MRRSSHPPRLVAKTPSCPPSVVPRLWPALPPQARRHLALEMARLLRPLLAPATPESRDAEHDVRR